jgi:hypothetical protein
MAIASAVKAEDKDLMGHLAALIEEGGEYLDDFKTQIANHPEANLIAQALPQLAQFCS